MVGTPVRYKNPTSKHCLQKTTGVPIRGNILDWPFFALLSLLGDVASDTMLFWIDIQADSWVNQHLLKVVSPKEINPIAPVIWPTFKARCSISSALHASHTIVQYTGYIVTDIIATNQLFHDESSHERMTLHALCSRNCPKFCLDSPNSFYALNQLNELKKSTVCTCDRIITYVNIS